MVPAHPNGFHGIYPATLCPFTRDGEVDEVAVARHVADLAAVDGIVGVLCNGHAGENFLLSDAETRRVAEIVSGAIGDRAIVVSGVNREGSREAADLACEVVAAGADAIMVFPPNAWAGGQDRNVAVNHHRADSSRPWTCRSCSSRAPPGAASPTRRRSSRSSCGSLGWSQSRTGAGRSPPTRPIGGSSSRSRRTWR